MGCPNRSISALTRIAGKNAPPHAAGGRTTAKGMQRSRAKTLCDGPEALSILSGFHRAKGMRSPTWNAQMVAKERPFCLIESASIKPFVVFSDGEARNVLGSWFFYRALRYECRYFDPSLL